MLASLGGLDALVFTAGIGENSPQVRFRPSRRVLRAFWDPADAAKNEQSPPDADISAPDSAVRVLVIHTQEEWGDRARILPRGRDKPAPPFAGIAALIFSYISPLRQEWCNM